MAGRQYTNSKRARHTYGVREAAHFYDESSTRLQNLSNARKDAQRVTFAPMQRCVAENSVEFSQDLWVVLWKFQRLHISNKSMFDAVRFGLLDLWTQWSARRQFRAPQNRKALTMLSLKSVPTTKPPSFCLTTSCSTRVNSPLPQPRSRMRSPGCAARSSRTGAVNAAEYTKDAVLLYSEADHPDESGRSTTFNGSWASLLES